LTFTATEIIGLIVVGVVLSIIVGGYMVVARRKGWMRED
jgi:hypothetical protein